MSVYKPKNSPYYHFDFQRDGRRFCGSTGCSSRREAETAERLEKEQAARAAATRRAIDPASIDQAWERFWQEKGQYDAKPKTTFARLAVLQDGLAEILRVRDKRLTVQNITADIIAAYVARRRGTKSRAGRLLSNASVNRELQILRRVLRRAALGWALDVHLPAWGELMLPEADERVVDMPHALEEKILSYMRDDFRAAARWLILSGLRAGNALPLHPSAVDFETGILTVRQKSRKPGGKTHMLPITGPMQVLLANEIGHLDEAVFTYVARRTVKGRVRGQRYPLTPETFYNELKAAAAKAGHPGLRQHDLRHVAGTRTLRVSGNLAAAQKHLGHARISTTMKYAHFLMDELRAAMEAAHRPPAAAPASLTPPKKTAEQN